MKILMVLTSHDILGDTGRKTDSGLKNCAPYFRFPHVRTSTWTLVHPRWAAAHRSEE